MLVWVLMVVSLSSVAGAALAATMVVADGGRRH
jgi:hypothetical protein